LAAGFVIFKTCSRPAEFRENVNSQVNRAN
jgi:hypothetical protein